MLDETKDLQAFPVILELPVLWGDMDAFRHVNNTVYFKYFESARVTYGDRIGTHGFLEREGIGPILAYTSCNFLKPLRYPDTVRVGCRTLKLSRWEMEQEHAIYSMRLGALAATGSSRIVGYDYRALKRASFPQALIDRILQLESTLVVEES